MASRYNLRSRQETTLTPQTKTIMGTRISRCKKQPRSRSLSAKKSCTTPRTTSLTVISTQTAVQPDGASGVNSSNSPVSDNLPAAAQVAQVFSPVICDGYQEYCSPSPVSEPGYEKDTLPCVEVNLTSAELRLLPFRFQLSGATCDIHLPEAMHNSQQRGFEIYRRKPWFH